MLLPPVDLVSCASEPIRVPGAIQPHGWLLLSDSVTGRIVGYSANCGGLTQLSPGPALTAELQRVTDRLRHRPSYVEPSLVPALVGTVTVGNHVLIVSVHRSQTLDIFELELGATEPWARSSIYSVARQVLPMMERATSLLELARIAAYELHALSGFGRCLMYSFDEEGHAHVLGECCDPGYDSYLGHAFPATDIPTQARALYLANRFRLITDACYVPSSLLMVDDLRSAQSIDLTFASLRSVSPVHLEYMRNMGTLASMSVSLVVRGKLWGLISCHDHAPRTLDFDTRAACEHFGELVSLQIQIQQENARIDEQRELHLSTIEIVARLSGTHASLHDLVNDKILLSLLGADGAAIVFEDECWMRGITPKKEQILELAGWIDDGGYEDYETSYLEGTGAPSQDAAVASGILAVSLSDVHRHLIIWFRGETARTIRWAGEPQNQVDLQGRLTPRHSFKSWEEVVRGRSIAWSASEVKASLALRQALVAIVLRHVQQTAAITQELRRVSLARDVAEQADAAKTRFLAMLSHELRTPLTAINSAAILLGRLVEVPPKFSEKLAMIKRNVALEIRLIDDVLDMSAIAAGKLRLEFGLVDMHTLVTQVHETVTPDADLKDLQIHLDLRATACRVRADPVRMHQIVSNILRNAVKFTGQSGRILLSSESLAGYFVLTCKDNGIGIEADALARIFRAFEQADTDITRRFGGMGLGLAIAMDLAQAHGGKLVAHSEGRGCGATFTLSIPTIIDR